MYCDIVVPPLFSFSIAIIYYVYFAVVQPNDTSCNLFITNLYQGFIASHTTDVTGCGTNSLPWRIRASQGQTISVSMLDFTPPSVEGSCQMYANLKEKLKGKYKTLCGGKGSEVPAYQSSSHELELRVLTGSKGSKRNFLLKFEGEWMSCMVYFFHDLAVSISLYSEYIIQ